MADIELNLTEKQQRALQEIALRTGKTADELLLDAVDDALERIIKQRLPSGNSSMFQARGIWKDRDDLPDFGKLRREWERL
jgi:hypothetical protein